MSNLEDKLSASIQTQRRRPGTGKAGEGDKPVTAPPSGTGKGGAGRAEEGDLNAGGGRGPNPARIWPD